MMNYRPADTGLDGFDDSLMSRQHCLIHQGLVLTELAIGREGAGDVTVIAIVLAPHVQQQHVIAPNLPVCRATTCVGPTPVFAFIHVAAIVTVGGFFVTATPLPTALTQQFFVTRSLSQSHWKAHGVKVQCDAL